MHRGDTIVDGNIGAFLQTPVGASMLRSALLSLALAISFVLLGFVFVFPDSGANAGLRGEQWGSTDANVVTGLPVQGNGVIALQLDSTGRGIVEFDIQGAQLEELPVLHVDFVGRPEVLAMVAGWRRQSTGNDMRSRQVGISPGSDLWLDMSNHSDWAGKATTLALVFLGPPGGSVVVRSIELKPLVFPQTAFLTLADWTMFVPWRQSSINSHLGVVAIGQQPYPTLVAAIVALTALFIYAVGKLIFRREQRFDWRIPGVVVLLCWIGLDSLWQYKLLRQTEVTERTFADRSTNEKRLASEDSALYEFIVSVKGEIAQHDARLFIASANDFNGMRGAYFSYPLNAYWERHAASLPTSKFIRQGDYVLLLHPVRAGFDKATGVLRYGENMALNTELMLSNNVGALFKVI